MARILTGTLTLALALGLTSIVLAQEQQPGIIGPGGLLFNPDVRKELKLSDEQLTKLKDALGKVMAGHKDEFAKIRQMSPDEMQKTMKSFNDDSQKAISGVLDAKQMKRFQQIEWQLNGVGALQDPDLQKELKLSDEQKKKLDTLFKDAQKKMQDMAKSQETSQAKYQAVITDLEEKTNGVLTDEQKKNLKELKGAKFEFPAPPSPPPQPKKQ
jgi:hypothetical protein